VLDRSSNQYLNCVPAFDSVKSILSRKRSACFPPIPATIADVSIQHEWAHTWNDKRFLSSIDNGWGICLFMTSTQAKILRTCQVIYIDGTFRTAPHPYLQLVTVHGLWLNSVIPLCFCLSTGKTVGQYRQIIKGVRTGIRNATGHSWRQPSTVICDFEISLISAIQTELPNSSIRCCYFHYTQSLWRKFSSSGLLTAYRSTSQSGRRLKKCIQKIMAIGFIPTAMVRQVFDNYVSSQSIRRLQVRFPGLDRFLKYVSDTYISRTSMFSPPMWNVHSRTIDTRTNNHVER
jgi:hypothetical protein